MICAIDDQTRNKLLAYHAGKLLTLQTNRMPLDLRSYMNEVFGELVKSAVQGKDPSRTINTAYSYIQLTPGMIRDIFREDDDPNHELENYFAEKNPEIFSELARLDMAWTKSNEPIIAVRQYLLGKGEGIISRIKQDKQTQLNLSQEPGYTEKPVQDKPSPRKVTTPLEKIKVPFTIDKETSDNGYFGKGSVFLRIAGIAEPVRARVFSMKQDLVDKIIHTIMNPVYEYGEKISDERKVKLIGQYLNNSGKFAISTVDGKLSVLIDGKNIMGKPDAQETLLNYLTNNKSSFNIQPNIDARFLNQGEFNDYNLKKTKDGYDLQENLVNYNKWLGDKLYIQHEIKEGEPVSGELTKVVPQTIVPETSSKEPVDKITPELQKPEVTEQAFSEPVPIGDAAKASLEATMKLLKDNPDLAKLIRVKSKDLKATQKQIDDAKIWYDKHPLAKFVPYNTLFNIMNSNRVAEFFMHAINLYKGADYSDLYHESWHVFSQLFLTKDEKTRLYEEIKKRSGSFVTFSGKRVKFSNASYLQIEEHLAEDFRNYMLSDGKSVLKGSPARNTIFRRMWNFLKSLFKGNFMTQVLNDEKSVDTVKELYEKLRIGNINLSSFSYDNAIFGALGKAGVEAVNQTDQVQRLNPIESHLAVDTMNSSFTQYLEVMNKIVKERYEESKKTDPNTPAPNLITSRLIRSKAGKEAAYGYIRNHLYDLFDRLNSKYSETEKGPVRDFYYNNLKVLYFMIKNFGDKTEGLVKYYEEKNQYLPPEDEDENLREKNLPTFNKGGNEISAEAMADDETKWIIRSLYDKDADGNPIYNPLGMPKLVEFRPIWNTILTSLESKTYDEMEGALREEAQKTNPKMRAIIEQLLERLGPSTVSAGSAFNVWNSFYQTFNRFRFRQAIQTIDETSKDGESVFISKIGFAPGEHYRVQQLWNNRFKTGMTISPFVIKEVNGKTVNPYLDINKLIDHYKSLASKDQPVIRQDNLIGFLNDIGIEIDDSEGIRDEINSNPEYEKTAKYLWQRILQIKTLQSLSKNDKLGEITDLDILLNKKLPFYTKDDKGNPVKESRNSSNEAGRYRTIALLQAKYSNEYSDLSVSTPDGNRVYEQSVYSSTAVLARALNSANSYGELLNDPAFSYYDRRNNPWIAVLDPKTNTWTQVSKQLNSLFDFSQDGAPRRMINGKPVQFYYINMGGTVFLRDGLSTNSGIVSSQADEYSKFLMDFGFGLQKNYFEDPRAAEKGLSAVTGVSDIFSIYNEKNKNLYIDQSHFRNNPDMWNTIFKNIYPYLIAEHARIKIQQQALRDKEEGVYNPENNKETYTRNGSKFNTFKKILSKETKDKLLSMDSISEDKLSKDLRDLIKEDFTKYFNKLFDKTYNLYSKSRFTPDNIISEMGDTETFKGLSALERTNLLLRTFSVNAFISNIEACISIYGDPAMYSTSEELNKRVSGSGSPGITFRTDNTMISHINNVMGMLYAKSKGYEGEDYKFSKIIKTAVMKDPLLESLWYKEYKESFREAMRPVLSKSLSGQALEDSLNERAEIEAKAYAKNSKAKGMKVADGQGWISFDYYRALSKSENKWSDEQENLYKQIVNKEPVNLLGIKKFFPVRKYQYYGPLAKILGLSVMAFHKFSLFPLIPSVIENQPQLKTLHDKMVKENIGYSLLESGSKITTITDQGKTDDWNSDKPFTPNKIHLEFLKDQQNIEPQFKNKVAILTQLRAMIEEGLIEGKVPVDFGKNLNLSDRKKAWNKLSDKKKMTYLYWRLITRYEKAVVSKTDFAIKKLLKDIGWEKDKGKATEKLAKFIRDQLVKQDMGDHEINYVDISKLFPGELMHDLSYSLSAATIEKALASMINKRIVKQSINGEHLVQVADWGFGKIENPTASQIEQYSHGLKSYRIENGKVMAAQCRIALQGSFLKLIEMKHSDGKPIKVVKKSIKRGEKTIDTDIDEAATLRRLNETIQDEKWLNTGDNRKMITIVGARAPVQGLNSGEFFEVHEFMSQAFGNSIVPPYEIVAKSGSDFDVDKLTMMMFNLRYDKKTGEVSLFKNYNDKEAEDLYKEYKDLILERENIDNPQDYDNLFNVIFGFTPQEMQQEQESSLIEEEKIKNFNDFKESLNSIKMVDNELIDSILELISLPDSFASLMTPNDTYIMKPIAEKMMKVLPEGEEEDLSGTDLMEYNNNLNVHKMNTSAGIALAITALDNKANNIFNRVGAYLNSSYIKANKYGPGEFEKALTILMPHNTFEINGKTVISLSNLYDVANREKISNVISQIMNGTLEVAKDHWAYYIQANKEVIPTLLFLIQAGVDVEQAVYFISQPLVLKYISEVQQTRSAFSVPLDKIPIQKRGEEEIRRKNWYILSARSQMIKGENNPYGFHFTPRQWNAKSFNGMEAMYNEMNRLYSLEGVKESLDKGNLYKRLKQYKKEPGKAFTDADRANLLHFFDLEDMAKSVSELKFAINFDTKTATSAAMAMSKQAKIDMLSNNGMIPKDVVRDVLGEGDTDTGSAISGLYRVVSFMGEFLKPLFKTRANDFIGKFLLGKMSNMDESDTLQGMFSTPDKIIAAFYNDLMSYVYQNAIRDFNIKSPVYRSLVTDNKLETKHNGYLKFGAFVKDGTLFYDPRQMVNDFLTKGYTSKEYGGQSKLAPLSINSITTAKEYYNFVFEREYLRSIIKPKDLETNQDYTTLQGRFGLQMKEESQENINHAAFEEYLKNKALSNIGNAWKIFNSDEGTNRTYAEEVTALRDVHPKLAEQYDLLNILNAVPSKDGSMVNLQLLDSSMDGYKINIYNYQLEQLADPAIIKVNDPVENQRISDIFSRFPMVAFLQSGLTATGPFSMIRLVPNTKFSMIMENAVKKFVRKNSESELNDFYEKFKQNNSSYTKARYKDYTRDKIKNLREERNMETAGLDPVLEKSENSLRVDDLGQGYLLYTSPADITLDQVKGTLEALPDTIFIYDSIKTLPKNISAKANSKFVESEHANTLPIVTMLSFAEQKGTNLTDNTLRDNMRGIDEAVNNMLSIVADGKTLAFPRSGLGQKLIGKRYNGNEDVPLIYNKPGLKTFMYLSQQLYEKFGYINKNSDLQDFQGETIPAIIGRPYITEEALSKGSFRNIPVEVTNLTKREEDTNGFQGFKGGFENTGKGTPQGDGKDEAMRKIADGFVGELINSNGKTSSNTSYEKIGKKAFDTGSSVWQSSKNSPTAVAYPTQKIKQQTVEAKVNTVMLARNKEFSGKPLNNETKQEIDNLKYIGATFIVGDMPNVDSQFIDYLQQIGANFTIYHTGKESRIKVQPGKSQQIGARNTKGKILLDMEALKQKFEDKAWTNPHVLSDKTSATALPQDEFKSFDEFLTFVLLHEKMHSDYLINKGESRGAYEDRINNLALTDLRQNYVSREETIIPSTQEMLSSRSYVSDEEVRQQINNQLQNPC